MLTPQFKVEQNEDFIILYIKLKYVKISEVDFFIEKNNFKFHLKPYFLNLFFSDNLVQSDNCASKYNVENGILECRVQKEVKGTIFKDIDLLNNLMENPNKKVIVKPKIQVIEEGDTESNNELLSKEFKLHELNDILQNEISYKLKDLTIIKNYHYGFNNEFIDVFTNRDVMYKNHLGRVV
jgi:protein SHQ1